MKLASYLSSFPSGNGLDEGTKCHLGVRPILTVLLGVYFDQKSLGTDGVRSLINEAKNNLLLTWICEGGCQLLTSQQSENLKERPVSPFPELRLY